MPDDEGRYKIHMRSGEAFNVKSPEDLKDVMISSVPVIEVNDGKLRIRVAEIAAVEITKAPTLHMLG